MDPKKILIVDDDPSISKLLQRFLESEGYQIVLVESGQGAVMAIDEEDFFAVLLDLGLSDMNGLEVLREVSSRHPRLPVIVVTGSHEEAAAREAMSLGALDYVTKPVDYQYLFNILAMQGAS